MNPQPCHSEPNSPISWATAPKPILPPNAPTAGYLCGGGGIMTAGFETAGIHSLWNIDHDTSDPFLSQAIAQIYQTNFHHPVIRQTLQKVAASDRFNDLPTPDILVLTQSCKHLSKSNPKAKETQSDIDTATAAIKAFQTFHSPLLIIENVPEYQQSTSWQLIKTALIDLDYQFTAKILNSADFGIPQQRHRFLAIALKGSREWGVGSREENFPLVPQPTAPQPIGWYEAICDLLPHLEDIHPTPAQLQRLTNLPSHFLQQPLLIERVGAYGNPKVRLPHETSWTIRKSIWLDQRHNSRANAINIRLPDGTWKNLGIRGAARLMTIPDWFWLPDEAWISGSAIGNGVPSLLAAIVANAVKPYLPTAYPVAFSHKKVEVLPAIQESTSNKQKKANEILTQNQPTGSITMQSTTTSTFLDNYNFPPLTSSQTIALAREVVELGFTHTGAIAKLKEQGLELGYKLLELLEALGEAEFKQLLKHCFPPEIVRYYRNLVAQAKLIEKCPQLYDQILNMPICHAAALLAGTEEQIEQILTEDAKWTVSLIKQRIKADNFSIAPITEIAIGKPVKILASDSEHSGNLAIVENIQENQDISVQLLSGELIKFDFSSVKAIDPDTYLELTAILATSANLHEQFKTAADSGDERLINEIEQKLSKLDKCRRQLTTRLGLSDKAAKNLANTITSDLSQSIATQTDCDRVFRVWDIRENDREAILTKAELLAKLRTKNVDAQPTTGEIAVAVATCLQKPTTKHGGGGIPITTREYSQLTELVQEKDSVIQQLKAELDETKANRENNDKDDNISSQLMVMQQQIESLHQAYESLEKKYSEAISELETYKQILPSQPDSKDEVKAQTFEPGDIVRIVKSPIDALINDIGIFKQVEIENTICGPREQAVVILRPSTKFQMPVYISNYQESLLKMPLTEAELKQLVQAEYLANKNQELSEINEYFGEQINEAVYQLGRCLDRLGVPGWDKEGEYVDESGFTHQKGKALSQGIKAMAEILANVEPCQEGFPEEIEF
ncbi:DNA cytosine methyltransferase [Phormidium sp. LEGE 05292]|uniref:DNA cytosine methyltransferase n=1 Tax=[Phormidium] sp. LEGE 05292 TaxID=767427 RepID=UPI0018823527|nr:DNA cytosine methyltransferase [Phormidium sp. LEGE 05292]MBE9224064.1 DNA cytosine methyltransferase [Phormidium sp. LEGE 05292]